MATAAPPDDALGDEDGLLATGVGQPRVSAPGLLRKAALTAAGALGVLALLWLGRSAVEVGAPSQALSLSESELDARGISLAYCGIDIQQALFYIQQAGNYAKFAAVDCPNRSTAEEKLVCGADSIMIINSFGWAASYIADSVGSCVVRHNIDQGCATTLTALAAELVEFGYVATAVRDACEDLDGGDGEGGTLPQKTKKKDKYDGRLGLRVHRLPRARRQPSSGDATADNATARLFQTHLAGWQGAASSVSSVSNESDAAFVPMVTQIVSDTEGNNSVVRGAQTSQCVVDVNLGLSFLARAMLQLSEVPGACMSHTVEDQKLCAVDIWNVLSSLGWAAQFLAQIAVDCPAMRDARAGCAAVVSDFIAVVTAFGPVVNGINDDCPDVMMRPHRNPVGAGNLFS